MAVQINSEELENCPTYFQWMVGKIAGQEAETVELGRNSADFNTKGLVILGRNSADFSLLCKVAGDMFGTDFICEGMKEDEIRATDAMELRRRYADEVGAEKEKSEHDIDRIWKSIHGKCSVFELILSLCFRLDEMVNEDEPGTMVGMFFGILAGNLGFSFTKSEEPEEIKSKIDRFLKREYASDGTGGGLFPLKNWSKESSKDQKNVSIWYQMNTFIDSIVN